MKNIFTKEWFNTWTIMLACGIFYCYQFVLRVLPNTLSKEFMDAFHVDAAGFGILVAFYYASYAGLQIPLGFTLDRIKSKYLLPIAPLICALGAVGMAYSDNVTYAAISRSLMGIGSAFGFIGAVKVATIILPSNRISIAIGIIMSCGTFGAILGGRPVKALTDIYGWQQVMMYLAFIGVVISLILFMALSSTLIKRKREKAATIKHSILKDLKLIFKNPQIFFLSVYGMIAYLPITILGAGWGIGFIVVYFNAEYNTAATAIALMFIGGGIGSLLMAVLSEVFKSRKVTMLTSSILACILYTVLLYGGFKMLEYQLYLCLFLAGVFYSAKTLSFSLACDLVGKKTSGLTTSILNMTVMAAGLVFHPLIGFLLNRGHLDSAIYTKHDYKIALSILPIAALVAFILIIFIKDHKTEKARSIEDALFSIDE